MSDARVAEILSPEETAFFGKEAIAEALGDDEIRDTPIEEPSVAGAAEPPIEEKPAAGAEDNRTVSHAALHEERVRRQELQRELDAMRVSQAKAEERLAILTGAIAPPQPQKTIEEDPIAALKQVHEATAQMHQAEIQRQQYTQFASAVQQHENTFRSTTPDYDAALTHLHTARAAEYEALGLTPQQITQALHTDAVNVAAHALRSGKNPAELAYGLAKARGYAPAAAVDAGAGNNGVAAGAVGAAAAAVSGEKKMEMLERGQAAAKSLSGGGSSGAEDLTLESLASMNDAEFAEVHSKLSEAKLRKLFGVA